MSPPRRFKQVDVFTRVAFKGNPLAVVFDADGLSDAQMQHIARWTNLSETTFILPPTDPAADYRVRIFSPSMEFPFAGHPTLGTAHALLESGLVARTPGRLIQQCGLGLVTVAVEKDGSLAFRTPVAALAALDASLAPLLAEVLGTGEITAAMAPTVANIGIVWLVVRMPSAAACLAVQPRAELLAELERRSGANGIALFGPHEENGPADYEVRALMTEHGMLVEDPVTGSANACIAQVMQAHGSLDNTAGYRVRQGTLLGRDGRVAVTYDNDGAWIGGHTVTVIDGTLNASLSAQRYALMHAPINATIDATADATITTVAPSA